MRSTAWDEETVIRFLKSNGNFDDFLNGVHAGITYRIHDVDFLLYRNDIGVQLYYPSPYNPVIDYSAVETFFTVCQPILSKMVRDAADKRLTSK